MYKGKYKKHGINRSICSIFSKASKCLRILEKYQSVCYKCYARSALFAMGILLIHLWRVGALMPMIPCGFFGIYRTMLKLWEIEIFLCVIVMV